MDVGYVGDVGGNGGVRWSLTISWESLEVLRIFLSISSFVVRTSDVVCRVARSTVIRRKSANLFSDAFPAVVVVVEWAANGPWGPTPFDEGPLDMARACEPAIPLSSSSSLRDPSPAGGLRITSHNVYKRASNMSRVVNYPSNVRRAFCRAVYTLGWMKKKIK